MIPKPPVANDPQPDLFSQPVKTAAVNWLEKLLLEAKCWMTADDIVQTTFGKVIDREIRAVANDCPRIISGQKGYRHVAHASAEEITHAASWLESQAKKMSDRACAIRRYAHTIIR